MENREKKGRINSPLPAASWEVKGHYPTPPPQILTCRKIFFLCKKILPKVQNFEPKIPHVMKIYKKKIKLLGTHNLICQKYADAGQNSSEIRNQTVRNSWLPSCPLFA